MLLQYIKSTADVEMRKTHTCCYCGAVYTYLMKRKVFGFGLNADSAHERLNKNAEKVWRNGAAVKPCPNCGRCQSEMFADSPRARFFGVLGRGSSLLLMLWFVTLAVILWPFCLESDESLVFFPYALWTAFFLALAPTLRNFNRNPRRNLRKMEKSEKLRSELLGIRLECARKQKVKRGWFVVSAFFLATFTLCYFGPALTLGMEQDWRACSALGAAITAFAFVWMITHVPESVRFQGEPPITTDASEEALETLRQIFGSGESADDGADESVDDLADFIDLSSK